MFKCATAATLCVLHTRRPFPVRNVRRRSGKNLRHLASARLTFRAYVDVVTFSSCALIEKGTG